MSHIIRMFVVAVLTLSGPVGLVWADDPGKDANQKTSNMEMDAVEIEGSLGDIVGSFKLNRMEIQGAIETPRIHYDEPWVLPDPFYNPFGDTTRALIDKAYVPFDRNNLKHQAHLMNGTPQEASSEEFASSGQDSNISGFASFFSAP